MYDLSQEFKSDNLEVIAFTWRFRNRETTRLVNADFKNVRFVLLACLCYMTIHTGSFFLALVSLLNVFMSVPLTLVVYTYILGVTYFSSLHLSVVIIIVGIGSDDIFVFHDFWRSTFQIKALRNKPILRLSLAFRRASQSMLVTSLTSAVAFSSCIMSSIMPIKSFGYFATVVVVFVFV